jgi:hypothetical protein
MLLLNITLKERFLGFSAPQAPPSMLRMLRMLWCAGRSAALAQVDQESLVWRIFLKIVDVLGDECDGLISLLGCA